MKRTELGLMVVVAIFSNVCTGICASPDEVDPVAEAIRDGLDQDLQVGLLEKDGLTFEQREALYGFSVAPELLEDPIMYIGDGAIIFLIDGPDGLRDPDFELYRKLANAVSSSYGCLSLWVSNDEFHRALALDALDLADPNFMGEGETLYTMHVEPTPFQSLNPDGTAIPGTETIGLLFVMTPIP